MKVTSFKIDSRRFVPITHRLDEDGRTFSTSASWQTAPGEINGRSHLVEFSLHVSFDGRNYAIKLSPDEARELARHLDRSLKEETRLPSTVDLRTKDSVILDQGNLGSSAAHAASAALSIRRRK